MGSLLRLFALQMTELKILLFSQEWCATAL